MGPDMAPPPTKVSAGQCPSGVSQPATSYGSSANRHRSVGWLSLMISQSARPGTARAAASTKSVYRLRQDGLAFSAQHARDPGIEIVLRDGERSGDGRAHGDL